MSRDTIVTDDEGTKYSLDNARTQGWLDGHAIGLDVAADYLRERSVKLFREGKDDEAVRLRRLADEMVKELRPKMEERSSGHFKEFPVVIEQDKED